MYGREINVTANEGAGVQSNPPKAKPAGPSKTKNCLIIQTVSYAVTRQYQLLVLIAQYVSF